MGKFSIFNFQFSIKLILLFFIFYFLLFTFSYPVFAVDDIGQAKIYPASPLYFLKTIRESLELKFAGTSRVRMIRQLEFATRRLREVKSLITGNHEDLIEPTLERYFYHLSTLPDKDLTDKELVATVKDTLVIHLKTLEKISGQVTNSRAKMAIRSAMNKVIQRMDVPGYAKLPVCNFLAKEASSSALNEVERLVLKDRSQQCLRNLDTP